MAKRKVGKEKGKSVCRWIPCFMHIYISHIYQINKDKHESRRAVTVVNVKNTVNSVRRAVELPPLPAITRHACNRWCHSRCEYMSRDSKVPAMSSLLYCSMQNKYHTPGQTDRFYSKDREWIDREMEREREGEINNACAPGSNTRQCLEHVPLPACA